MKLIKYIIAWLPARILFGLGHLVSLTIRFDSVDLYFMYSWFMEKSSDIDLWGNTNLWKDVKNENEQHD